MEDHSPDKHLDYDKRDPVEDFDRRPSITSDKDGNTVVEREDGEVFTIDRKAEKALVWKFDLRILPLLALMYLFNALDKSNLGNAKTVCITKTLATAATNNGFARLMSL